MRIKKFLSILLIMTFIFMSLSIFTAPHPVSAEVEKPDFSFFSLDPSTDEYIHGLAKFSTREEELINELTDENERFDNADGYYQIAEAMQWPLALKYFKDPKYQVQDIMDTYSTDNPDNDSNFQFPAGYYDALVGINDYFTKFYNDNMLKAINSDIGLANANKSSMLSALEYTTRASKYIDACLLIVPDSAVFKSKKAEIQKVADSISSAGTKNVSMTAFQKQNVGKILFSSTPIVPGKETASQFKTSFKAGENIYAIMYLPIGVKTLDPGKDINERYDTWETGSLRVYVNIDGEYAFSPNLYIPVDMRDYAANKPYVIMELNPSPKSTYGYDGKMWFDEFVQMGSGSHEIVINLPSVGGTSNIAIGSFTLDWTNADVTKIQNNVNNCMKIAETNRANIRSLPKEFSSKSASYKDSILSDASLKSLCSKRYKNVKKILKVVRIGSNKGVDWWITRGSFDVPLYRDSDCAAWVLYQGSDGWDYISRFTIRCQYAGGGKYNGPVLMETFPPAKISAKNVK